MSDPFQWIGYLEHKSDALLGIYQANIGKGGFTIFAEMIRARGGRNLHGLPWCAVFVHAVLNRSDLLGKPHPGTKVLLRRMKRRGFWKGRTYHPQPGDIIFCGFRGAYRNINHVGIVVAADSENVSSVDGNTVDPDGHFPPEVGGAVALRIRRLDNPMIYGYGAVGRFLYPKLGQKEATTDERADES